LCDHAVQHDAGNEQRRCSVYMLKCMSKQTFMFWQANDLRNESGRGVLSQ